MSQKNIWYIILTFRTPVVHISMKWPGKVKTLFLLEPNLIVIQFNTKQSVRVAACAQENILTISCSRLFMTFATEDISNTGGDTVLGLNRR